MDVDGYELRAAIVNGRVPGPYLRSGSADPRVAASRAAAAGSAGRAAPSQRQNRDRLSSLAPRSWGANGRVVVVVGGATGGQVRVPGSGPAPPRNGGFSMTRLGADRCMIVSSCGSSQRSALRPWSL